MLYYSYKVRKGQVLKNESYLQKTIKEQNEYQENIKKCNNEENRRNDSKRI